MVARLVPDDFEVPASLTGPGFQLRMLRETDAEADYEAVMESQVRLRAGSPHGWPQPGFTLVENAADLARHEAEFLQRIAFAYTIVNPAGDRVLGCLYFNPSESADVDAYLWLRDSEHDALIHSLFQSAQQWLEERWPFTRVNFVRTEYYQEALAARGGSP